MAKKASKKTAARTGTKTAGKAAAKKPVKPAKKAAAGSTNKTVPTDASVAAYLSALPPARRADCEAIAAMMRSVVKEEPRMWGPSIVGFGEYHYRYESGREGDMPLTGFSSRSGAISVYVLSGFDGEPDLMARLGKHKTGKSCLYVKSLADVDAKVLKELIRRSVAEVRRRHPG